MAPITKRFTVRAHDTNRLPPLRGYRLRLAQAATLALTALSILMVIVGRRGGVEGPLGLIPTALIEHRMMAAGISYQAAVTILDALSLASWVFTLGVGLLILWRCAGDRVGLLTAFMLLVTDQTGVTAMLIDQAAWAFPASLLLTLTSVSWILFLFIFPSGRFAPRWTRWVVIVNSALAALFILFNLFSTGAEMRVGMAAGPSQNFFLTALIQVGLFLLNMGMPLFNLITYATFVTVQGFVLILGIITQIHRYRRVSTPHERQQTKWVLIGLLGAAVLAPVSSIVGAIWGTDMSPFWTVLLLLTFVLSILSMAFIAAALAVAVLRFRLWDIDLVISRGLVYAAMTVMLVIFFVVALLAVQRLFPTMGSEHGPIAFAVSALIIGASFQPVRRRLQAFIDRRFYGIQVDYRQKPSARPIAVGDLSGAKVGGYEVIEPLGRGGMAEVWKGRHPTLGRTVAIKLLPAALAKDAEFRRRFEREAKVVAGLKHPHIIQVFDFGEAEGTYYMVMEYLEGYSLADTMREVGPMRIEQAKPIITEIAGALDYAHGQGVIHRDIKPANVMLEPATTSGGRGQRAVLMDFGIAHMVGGRTRITGTGVIGTFDYMAPEQIRDAKNVDGRTDIYSLGVMAFQMLTGKLPFAASNPGALLIMHMQQPAPDPRSLRPELPEEVADAILKALEKDPDNRFITAGEMVKAIE